VKSVLSPSNVASLHPSTIPSAPGPRAMFGGASSMANKSCASPAAGCQPLAAQGAACAGRGRYPAAAHQPAPTCTRFFAAWVSGRGHYPALRVGRQPYGIMVTSAWKSWASGACGRTLHGIGPIGRRLRVMSRAPRRRAMIRFSACSTSWSTSEFERATCGSTCDLRSAGSPGYTDGPPRK
jgi:hypothetical protein